MTLPPLPPVPIAVLAPSEIAALRVWAEVYATAAVKAEQERCLLEVQMACWMPRVEGRWIDIDVAYAEGHTAARREIAAAIRARKEQA